MNIFNVLSQGKSNLHEPSVSAMLGYLLSPNGDHGIGDTFLRSFIQLIEEKSEHSENFTKNGFSNSQFINANIELEVQYKHLDKRNDIDIQISFFDTKNEKEIHKIIIENKIRETSGNTNQLVDYYNAVIADEDYKLEKPALTVIFLTPKSNNKTLTAEFENLKKNIKTEHNCVWLYWSDDEEQNSVIDLIKNILQKELTAEINPINEYMRHTLKGFVNFMTSRTSNNSLERKMRTGEDIGTIVDDVTIQLKNGKEYRIIRRDSSQIQVYNLASFHIYF